MEKAWDLFWQTGKVTDYLNCCSNRAKSPDEQQKADQEVKNADKIQTEGR